MKNSKTKKVMAAILAATLITGTAGVLINKSDASFKFVVDTEDKLSTADVSLKIYDKNNPNVYVLLDKNTIGKPVELPFDFGGDKCIPSQKFEDYIVIENNSKIPFNVEISIIEETDKSIPENAALSKFFILHDVFSPGYTDKILPNEETEIRFVGEFRNFGQIASTQGNNNSGIGGQVKYKVQIVVKQ